MANVQYDFIDDAERILVSRLLILKRVPYIFYNGFILFIYFTQLLTQDCVLHVSLLCFTAVFYMLLVSYNEILCQK